MTTDTVSDEHTQQPERLPVGESSVQSRGHRRRKHRIYGGVVILLLVLIGIIVYPKVTEEIAYVRGIEAYAYGLPLVMMDVSNQVMTATSNSGDSRAPINQFWRMRKHVTPEYKDIVRVSTNSLWSVAVIDLDKEPLVISHPDTNGRFIIIQLMNMWSDDYGSIGSRATGTGAGNFFGRRAKWNGPPPPDIRDIYRSTTLYGWILVQIASKGPEDYAAVNALQDQLKITPLSAWGKPYTPPDNVPVNPMVDTEPDPFNQVRLMDAGTFFNRLAHLMVDNPPYPADAPMVATLEKLGVEPGKDFDLKVDPDGARGLKRVPTKAWSLLAAGAYTLKVPNGWFIVPDLGRYGTDYTSRALVAWGGLGALTREDVILPDDFRGLRSESIARHAQVRAAFSQRRDTPFLQRRAVHLAISREFLRAEFPQPLRTPLFYAAQVKRGRIAGYLFSASFTRHRQGVELAAAPQERSCQCNDTRIPTQTSYVRREGRQQPDGWARNKHDSATEKSRLSAGRSDFADEHDVLRIKTYEWKSQSTPRRRR